MAQNPSSGFPQASWLAQQNRQGQVPPSNYGEGGYSSTDPMQGLAQQAVQNPNAGDMYKQAAVADAATNPDGSKKEKPGWGPKIPGVSTMAGDADAGEIGVATVAGMGTAGLAYYLTKNGCHVNHAEKFEKFKPVGWLSQKMDKIPSPKFLTEKDWYKYWSLSYPKALNGKTLAGDELEAHIIQHQQGVHVERSLRSFNKSIESGKRSVWSLGISKTKDLKQTYTDLHNTLSNSEHRQKVLDLHRDLVHEKLGFKPQFDSFEDAKYHFDHKLTAEDRGALAKGDALNEAKVTHASAKNVTPGGFKYPITNAEEFARATYFDGKLLNLTKTDALKAEIKNNLKTSGHVSDPVLNKVVQTQDIKRRYLEQKVKAESASPEQKALLKRLSGTHDFLDKGVLQSSGVAGGNIREKAELTRQMRERKIGSIGKFYVTTMNHMKNIFGGDMLMGSMGKGKAAMLPMLVIGSLISSAMVIAPAIHAGNQADKGDKTKSFLENFVGFGICNFVGWELGRRFLAGTGLMHKLLGRHSLKHPLKFMKPIPGFLGRWGARTTLGGFATELVAMFAAGAIAESMGKKVVDFFFPGNGNKKDPNAPGANAMAVSGQDTASFGGPAGGAAAQPSFGGASNTGAAQAGSPSSNADTGSFSNTGSQNSQYLDILNSSMVKNADSMIQNPYGPKQQPYGLSGA